MFQCERDLRRHAIERDSMKNQAVVIDGKVYRKKGKVSGNMKNHAVVIDGKVYRLAVEAVDHLSAVLTAGPQRPDIRLLAGGAMASLQGIEPKIRKFVQNESDLPSDAATAFAHAVKKLDQVNEELGMTISTHRLAAVYRQADEDRWIMFDTELVPPEFLEAIGEGDTYAETIQELRSKGESSLPLDEAENLWASVTDFYDRVDSGNEPDESLHKWFGVAEEITAQFAGFLWPEEEDGEEGLTPEEIRETAQEGFQEMLTLMDTFRHIGRNADTVPASVAGALQEAVQHIREAGKVLQDMSGRG